jgi:hypothetical protein
VSQDVRVAIAQFEKSENGCSPLPKVEACETISFPEQPEPLVHGVQNLLRHHERDYVDQSITAHSSLRSSVSTPVASEQAFREGFKVRVCNGVRGGEHAVD